MRFTHEIVDAYLHGRTHQRAPVDVTIKPAFTPTLALLDFTVVIYRDHVATARSPLAVSRATSLSLRSPSVRSQPRLLATFRQKFSDS